MDKDIKYIYYSGFAKTDSMLREERLKKVLEVAFKHIKKNPEKILDIGCGDGSFTALLGKSLSARELYGVDISPRAIELAIKHNVKSTVLDIDKEDLPYNNEYFDFVYCGNLIELVINADHLLSEINRVLKTNGQCIITFPNLNSWGSRISVLFGFHPYYDRVSTKVGCKKFILPLIKGDSTGFIRLFNVNSFKIVAEYYGLKVMKYYGSKADGMPKVFSFLDGVICKKASFAFQIIAVLNKRGENCD